MESLAYIHMALAYEELQSKNTQPIDFDAEKCQSEHQQDVEKKSPCSRNERKPSSISKTVKA